VPDVGNPQGFGPKESFVRHCAALAGLLESYFKATGFVPKQWKADEQTRKTGQRVPTLFRRSAEANQAHGRAPNETFGSRREQSRKAKTQTGSSDPGRDEAERPSSRRGLGPGKDGAGRPSPERGLGPGGSRAGKPSPQQDLRILGGTKPEGRAPDETLVPGRTEPEGRAPNETLVPGRTKPEGRAPNETFGSREGRSQ
jgi:hypothetical protein